MTDHVKANQISAAIRFGVALLISVMLVRSHLTDYEVGTIEYAILLAYSFSFFWAFAYTSGILSRIASFSVEERKKSLQDVFLQLFVIAGCMSMVTLLILSVFQSFGAFAFYEISNVQVALFCFLLIVGIIPEVYYIINKEAKSIIYYSLLFNTLLLVLLALGLYFHFTIIQLFSIYIAIQLGRLVLGIYLVKPHFRWHTNRQKAWFIYILPLVGHFILGSSMDYIDGHLVAQFFDEEQFLFYRYGARELPFSLLFINAISAAMIPVLAENLGEIEDLKSRISRLMHFLFPISIVFLFISPGLFQLVYGEQFTLSAKVFNVYILIISSRILMPQLVLYAKNDNKALMIFSGVELIINIILSLIFMQIWGILGIALATVLAFAVNKILSVFYCSTKYKVVLKQYINMKLYGVYMLGLLISFFISMSVLYG